MAILQASLMTSTENVYQAARHGNIVRLSELIQAKANINARDNENRRSPLHYATEHGQLGAVQVLLAANANPNTYCANFLTPLHYPAQHGHSTVAQALIVAKASVNARDGQGKAPLYHAAERDSGATMQVLLDAKAEVNIRSDDSSIPLHHAAKANVDERGKYNYSRNYLGHSPLELAIERSQHGVVQVLLDAKADVADLGYSNPLHSAAMKGDPTVLQAIINAKASFAPKKSHIYTLLTAAAACGDIPLLQAIIESGLNVNNRASSECLTPLHYAAVNGQRTAVQMLLFVQADVNQPSRQQKSIYSAPLCSDGWRRCNHQALSRRWRECECC